MREKQKYLFITILSLIILSCGENNRGPEDQAGQIVSPSARAVEPDINQFVKVDEVPQVLTKVNPKYPELLAKAGVEGAVYVKALVTQNGQVRKAVVVRHSAPELEHAAIDAIQQWTFKPATLNGQPTSVWVVIPVKFRLSKN